MNFDPMNREHKAIVITAMLCADQFGVGRLTAAIEQLKFNDITIPDRHALHRYIYVWGQEIDEACPIPHFDRNA